MNIVNDEQLIGLEKTIKRFMNLSRHFDLVGRHMKEVENSLIRLLRSGRLFNRSIFESITAEMNAKVDPIELLSRDISLYMDKVLSNIVRSVGTDRKVTLLEDKLKIKDMMNSKDITRSQMSIEMSDSTNQRIKELEDGTYYGDLVGDKRHGKGELYHKSGTYCYGTFVEDRFEGQGIFVWPNGDIYKGDFVNNSFNGRGVLYCHNGEIYDGEFMNDCRHGQGILYYKDDSRFNGYFVRNKKHGPGVKFYANGDMFEGNYSNDHRDGKGYFYFADGTKETHVYEKGILKQKSKGVHQ